MGKEEKVRRKLEKREKERVKSRLGAVVKVEKPEQRNVSVRRAEFSSEQPLSELLRRSRKEEPLRELSTRQRSDEVFRSELLASRKDPRRAEPLPSASDYSDLESPERETAPTRTKLLSVVSKPIDRDRQAMEVAREERRLRMLQREM